MFSPPRPAGDDRSAGAGWRIGAGRPSPLPTCQVGLMTIKQPGVSLSEALPLQHCMS